ncbi:MAG: APC family permease [Gammaproteobacteria bacterium]
MQNSQPKKVLGTFTLSMMAIAAIINLRGLPLMASMGLHAIFFYLAAAIFFLIPSGLVCAELATTYPEAGGIYLWVKRAFGERTGFLAIWLEWFNNVISYPATLSFMATTLAYLFDPKIAEHKAFIFITTLFILWFATFFNILGVKASSRLNVVGALLGTLIPGLAIILLGIFWLFGHNTSQIDFSFTNIFPAAHFSNFVFFSGVLSGYSGMQIIAFHAANVDKPQRSYTKAIGVAVVLILLTTILAALSIGVVVPKHELTLVGGLMQGFTHFFSAFHMTATVPILAALILIGGFSSLSAWLLGPARGLAVAANQAHFFKIFSKENKNGSPVAILLLQAIVASLFSSLFLYMPSTSTAFWMLIDMSSQSTLLMYVLIFASAIYLRFREPTMVRPFKIPGGRIGITLIAGLPILACLGAIITSFSPPEELLIGQLTHYETILVGSNIVYLLIPFLIAAIMIKRRKLD